MSPVVIIDTDILIDVSRDISEALDCLQQVEQNAALAISLVTQMELLIGCRNQRELQTLEKFLLRFQVLKLNEPVSDKAVDLLRQYRLSHGLLIADALIAATAISLSVPLVSKNQRDYRFIDGLNLLPYPNPFSSSG
jgi:predicted nucleic acid-binding protein